MRVSKCCGAPLATTTDPKAFYYFECTKCGKGCLPVKESEYKKEEAKSNETETSI